MRRLCTSFFSLPTNHKCAKIAICAPDRRSLSKQTKTTLKIDADRMYELHSLHVMRKLTSEECVENC
jgi:hypothetical protein